VERVGSVGFALTLGAIVRWRLDVPAAIGSLAGRLSLARGGRIGVSGQLGPLSPVPLQAGLIGPSGTWWSQGRGCRGTWSPRGGSSGSRSEGGEERSPLGMTVGGSAG